MKTIKELYDNLECEETMFFQAKSKKHLIELIRELNDVFDTFDKVNHLENIKVKNTWFVLGNWRDGMFRLYLFDYWDNYEDEDVYILADTKKSPLDNLKHQEQIQSTIKVLDKYRKYLTQKMVCYDDNFNIVRKK